MRIRDKALIKRKRRFANYVKQVISTVLTFAADRNYIAMNPIRGMKNIKRPKDMDRANRPWTDSERFTIVDEAPWHIKVPVALCMYLALTEADALSLPKADLKARTIEGKRGKTGVPYFWELPLPLRKILANAPAHEALTIAANSNGKTWTPAGFRASWRKYRLQLEKDGKIATGLTIHGLRHSMGHLLTEEGKGKGEVRAALQQKTEAAASIYSADADLKNVMKGVAKTVNAAEIKRRKLATRAKKAGNPKG